VRALVQVLDWHALAAQRELGAELPDSCRSPHAAFRVQDCHHDRCGFPLRRTDSCCHAGLNDSGHVDTYVDSTLRPGLHATGRCITKSYR
jgi:hypothetical protein